MKFKINRAFFGYALAGAAMLLFFLYLRFPCDAIRDYIKASAAASCPDMLLMIDAVEPAIPPGITLENLTAVFRGRPEATIRANRLSIAPGWLSMLRGRVSFLATADVYGGEIRGRGAFSEAFSLRGPFSAAAEFKWISIEKCAWLQNLFSRKLSGTLKGAVSFNGARGSLKNGSGNLDLTLTNGTYQLLGSFFGIDQIIFNSVDLKVDLRNGALRIAGLTVNGEKLRVTLKGNILLADDFKNSRVDLSGSVELQGQGGKRTPITIGGVMGNPTIKLM